jgi:hypothetical protein
LILIFGFCVVDDPHGWVLEVNLVDGQYTLDFDIDACLLSGLSDCCLEMSLSLFDPTTYDPPLVVTLQSAQILVFVVSADD